MKRQECVDVSVIIPCYQCADTIHRAVRSVYAQTLRPAEVILVEDCSGDDTLDTLFELKGDYPEGWIKVVPLEKNSGPGDARNIGWELASSSYLAFLDADDGWHPQKIEIQYSWMLEHPEVSLTGHAVEVFSGGRNIADCADVKGKISFNKISRGQILLANRFSTPTVMLRRILPQRFAKGKRASEDFLLWCEILLDGFICCRNSLPLAYLFKPHYGSGGLSGKLWLMTKGELDTYNSLYGSGRIKLPLLLSLRVLSLTKHFKRVVWVAIRKLGGT